jgi:hypothetical protein
MISKQNLGLAFRIINSWLGFLLLLVILSNLPHWEGLTAVTWIIFSIYFLIFLLCVAILVRDRYNKAIFFNFAVFAGFYAFGFVHAFIGDNYVFGSNALAYLLFAYRQIATTLLLSICVVFIAVRYLFFRSRTLVHYAITMAVVIPVFVFNFYPYLVNPQYYLYLDNDLTFYQALLNMEVLPLVFVVFYAILLYHSDKPIGEHINAIMVGFFITTLADTTSLLSHLTQINLYNIEQYVLLINLFFFIVTLFRKLDYAYSDFGQFYEELLANGSKYNVPVKRRAGWAAPLLVFAKEYFTYRRNTMAFLASLFIFMINYFQVSPFLKLNIAVLAFAVLVLGFYLSALYHKRSRNGDLIVLGRK